MSEEHDPYLQVEALEDALTAAHAENAKLRTIIHTQAEEAAKAAREYADNMERMRGEVAGVREAFEQIEFRATNHGGWFDQPGQQFAEYCKLGHMASEAAKRIRALQEKPDA